MNILYVGDNRDRLNWGCRATSIALHDLISSDHKIIGTIYGKESLAGFTPVLHGSIFPRRTHGVIHKFRKKKLLNIPHKLFVMSGGKSDYISDDLDQAAAFMESKGRQYPHLASMLGLIEKADAVVVNGEGTFIFSTPPRRDTLFYLLILKMAQRKGKKTFLLNSMFSDSPSSPRNEALIGRYMDVFRKCNFISARDMQSKRYLDEIGLNANSAFIPDALFTWRKFYSQGLTPPVVGNTILPFPEMEQYWNKFDFTTPYICVSGSSVATKVEKSTLINTYVSLVQSLASVGIRIYIVPTCDGDAFLEQVAAKTNVPLIPPRVSILTGAAILGGASAFVSGRFHPSIMASIGGTPCVFMSSNAHKTRSIQEVLEYETIREYNAVPSVDEISRIVQDVKDLLSRPEARQKITTVADKLAQSALNIENVLNKY